MGAVVIYPNTHWTGISLFIVGIGGFITFIFWWNAPAILLSEGDRAFMDRQYLEARKKYHIVKSYLKIASRHKQNAEINLRMCLLSLAQKAQPGSIEHDLFVALQENPRLDYPDFDKLAQAFHIPMPSRMRQIFRNVQLNYFKDWIIGNDQQVIKGSAVQVVERFLEKGEAAPSNSLLLSRKVKGKNVAMVPELRRNTGAVLLEAALTRRISPEGKIYLILDLVVRDSQHFYSEGGSIFNEFVNESYLSDLLNRPGLWYALRDSVVEDIWFILRDIIEFIHSRSLRNEIVQLNIHFSRYFPIYWVETERTVFRKSYQYYLGDRRILGSYTIDVDLSRSSRDCPCTTSGDILKTWSSIPREGVQLKIV